MIWNGGHRWVAVLMLLTLQTALLANAAPTRDKKLTSAGVDLHRIYEPNPPVTHRCLLTFQYPDPATKKIIEKDIMVELYGTMTPKTADNFASVAKGVTVKVNGDDKDIRQVSYKGAKVDQIIPDGMIQTGNILPKIGRFSIYGRFFADENHTLKFDRPGRLGTWSNKKDENTSQFFISTKVEPFPEWDDRYVAFGQVITGLDFLLDEFQFLETDENNNPGLDVKISYSLLDSLAIADKNTLQKEYMEKLEAFRNGETSLGVTLQNLFTKTNKVEQQNDTLKDLRFNQLHHPLPKVIGGIVILLLLYVIIKSKRSKILLKK